MVGIIHRESMSKYLTLYFLGLEPRRQRDEAVNIFVDLGATHEDHEEVTKHKFSNSDSLICCVDWERKRRHDAGWQAERRTTSYTEIQ
jgi:hypothetical protein